MASATRSCLRFVFPLLIPLLLLSRLAERQVYKLNQIHKLCKKRRRGEIPSRGAALEIKSKVMTKTDTTLDGDFSNPRKSKRQTEIYRSWPAGENNFMVYGTRRYAEYFIKKLMERGRIVI